MREPRFSRRPWGYDTTEVDAFVERTAARLRDALDARTVDGAVREALDRLGDETAAILQRAHEIADEVTARSREEAAELTARSQREAAELAARSRQEAQAILQSAEAEAAALEQAAEARVTELDAEIDALWRERQRLLDDIERISEQFHALASGAKERFPAEDGEDQPTVETPASVVIRPDDA
jgi:DivIVA domain-containing protein